MRHFRNTLIALQLLCLLPTVAVAQRPAANEPQRLSSTNRTAASRATLRFRKTPVATSSAVLLKDLVEIVAGRNAYLEKNLSEVVGPAPQVGASQTWHKSDILQHLELRGVHPSSIDWQGSGVAHLQRRDSGMVNLASGMTQAFASPKQMEVAKQNVATAIAQYIAFKTGERTRWEVETRIPDTHVKTLQGRRAILQIGGGKGDFLGEQEFVLQIKDSTGKQFLVKVQANVKLPEMVVVASRPLRKDEVLQPDALKLKVLHKSARKSDKYYTSIDQVVGKQIRRSLATGLPLNDQMVGEPIVISRAQLVTVESVAGGITVSSPGKALSPGATGELIQVELPGRVKVYGTVVDSNVVRIAARATPSR